MSDAKKYSIYEAIPMITGAVAPIAKSKTNPQQNYKFRGIDDVYAALNLLLAKYGVSILPEVLESKHEIAGSTKSGSNMYRHVVRIRYHLFAADGSEAKADSEGEGMDTGDKATAKAFSMSFKTMAFQVFAIPTDEKIDAEEDSPEVTAAEKPAAPNGHTNGNGHAPAHAPQKAPAGNGAAAVTQATAFAATADAITSAGSAGDLAVISERLPKIDLTEGQRRILKARLDARLKQVGGAQA